MIKKMLCLVVSFSLFFVYLAPAVNALEMTEIGNGLMEENRMQAIDRLFAERVQLFNSDNSADALARIDYQLELLGVETISAAEAYSKIMNGAEINASAPTSDAYTSWTSVRTMYMYQGTQYEIQIIKAIPNGSSGTATDGTPYPLLGVERVGVEKVYGMGYAAQEALRFIINKAGETIVDAALDEAASKSKLGVAIKMLKEIFEEDGIYDVIVEAESAITTLPGLDYIVTCSMAASEEYIFVKIPNNPDVGHQVFTYLGNQIECLVNVNGSYFLPKDNGEGFTPMSFYSDTYYTFASSGFYDKYEVAVENFLSHRSGYSFDADNLMHSVTLKLLTGTGEQVTATISVPYIKYIGYF